MKDKLIETLGAFGLILWYLLSFIFVVVPIWATGFPWWGKLLIFAVIMLTDVLGAIVSVLTYAYSFFVVINSPFGIFSVIFFIDMALYLIFMLIPTIFNMIVAYRARRG